jgi:hypothetical protein
MFPVLINTMAFNCRCIPDRCVARRAHSAAIVAFPALRSGRIVNLGASPVLRTGELRREINFKMQKIADCKNRSNQASQE